MMLRVLSISMVALLLAAVAFAALETWIDVDARQSHQEILRPDEAGRTSHSRGSAEGSLTH